MSYARLDELSRRFATGFQTLGLRHGEHIALMLPNDLWFHPICWGAWFCGLYFTPISTRLQQAEVEHIITDSGSSLVVVAPEYEPLMARVKAALPGVGHWYTTGVGDDDFVPIRSLIDGVEPLDLAADAPVGSDMLYSSGTTGRPRGILPRLGRTRDEADPLSMLLAGLYGFEEGSVYLNPAPLYHGSPLKFTMAIHRFGGTNVIMSRFDAEAALAAIDVYRLSRNRLLYGRAEAALAAIDVYRVTDSQWVPTMLNRMLRLSDEVKARYDLSSHKAAVHAAAPCPPELKRQLIDWWGPIIHEFYAGSEAIGFTAITSEEWLRHPGSVGRSVMGDIHIVGEDGEELQTGEIGDIYFANGPKIAYHNDPRKTASATHAKGWMTIGDVGRLDEQGYLYLSDRRDFMIITGGVNVYPKEVEDLLAMHPDVEDVAVFGVPNAEFGEEVKAVVQPRLWPADETAFAEQLIAYCRAKLSPIKVPRSLDLTAALPRQENGKLYKKTLRAAYHAGAAAA